MDEEVILVTRVAGSERRRECGGERERERENGVRCGRVTLLKGGIGGLVDCS